MDGAPGGGFVARYLLPWAGAPFPWAVGALTLVLFAHLAATYLTLEAPDAALRETFRRRALRSQGALLVLSLVTLALARLEHPALLAGLTRGRTALAMHAVTSAATVTVVWALVRRRFALARVAAAAQASFLLWGWAWTQFPLLIPPSRTITISTSPLPFPSPVPTQAANASALPIPPPPAASRALLGLADRSVPSGTKRHLRHDASAPDSSAERACLVAETYG
jgi:cytochrome d ubiquinol oxidase subunit II